MGYVLPPEQCRHRIERDKCINWLCNPNPSYMRFGYTRATHRIRFPELYDRRYRASLLP